MTPEAIIEDHHELQDSRAEVALTDMRLGLDVQPRQIDRAVMLDVERRPPRTDIIRPRSAA
jgi:hypothetical protein